MKRVVLRSSILVLIALFAAVITFAQNAENDASSMGKPDRSESPHGMRDQLVKMQIDREKKTYQEMLDRGTEAAKIGEEVEKSFETKGSLSVEDRQKIDELEKLVKKIRGELGGSDPDDTDDDAQKDDNPKDVVSGVKYLRDSTARLLDELKKTSRFTISAMAIQSSNSVLKVTRFLRLEK